VVRGGFRDKGICHLVNIGSLSHQCTITRVLNTLKVKVQTFMPLHFKNSACRLVKNPGSTGS
jgi:hypothetical protein